MEESCRERESVNESEGGRCHAVVLVSRVVGVGGHLRLSRGAASVRPAIVFRSFLLSLASE
jgi:hypothetical protein